MSRRGRREDTRRWSDLQAYLAFCDRCREPYRPWFVSAEHLTCRPLEPGRFAVVGRIDCVHGLFLDVDEELRSDARGRVSVIDYSYHAGIAGGRDRPIFRYDSANPYGRAGHPDEHHRHRFDPLTWREVQPPEWIGGERRPDLAGVIEELRQWWETIGRSLDLPDHDDEV